MGCSYCFVRSPTGTKVLLPQLERRLEAKSSSSGAGRPATEFCSLSVNGHRQPNPNKRICLNGLRIRLREKTRKCCCQMQGLSDKEKRSTRPTPPPLSGSTPGQTNEDISRRRRPEQEISVGLLAEDAVIWVIAKLAKANSVPFIVLRNRAPVPAALRKLLSLTWIGGSDRSWVGRQSGGS